MTRSERSHSRHRRNRLPGVALSILGAAACLSAAAADGITLQLSKGEMPFSARLEWTGGQPDFQILRDSTPTGAYDVVNLEALTSDFHWNEPPTRPPPGRPD